ncbi:MAG TPA: hypothetical protein EYP73_04115 [Acidimicrobiia bacterium]|nr:hypothetical protein [Acidimicrobiia bacterium]
MKIDAALNVTSAYLRVNGYFVLTELEFHQKADGGYRAITDVDILALRLPTDSGPAHYHAANANGAVECLLAGQVDPALEVATDRIDVIIGEVKRGEVSVNEALRDPRVLHAALRRIGRLTPEPLDVLVDDLVDRGEASTPTARIRIVAFGLRGSATNASVVHHDHMIDWLDELLGLHRDLFEVTNFSDPVLSLLALSASVDRPFTPVES